LVKLLSASRRERFVYAERAAKRNERERDHGREKIRQTLLAWESFWRDLFLTASGADMPLVNLDWEADIHRLAEQIGPSGTHTQLAGMEQALERQEHNVNPRLLLEVLFLDWPRV
jgi:DNA polymerase III subunit delta'